MASFRLIFVATIAVVAIGYCRCDEGIPNSEIEFDLIRNQPDSFEEKIVDALKPRKTVFASETSNKAFKIIGAGLKKIPEFAPFTSVLPAIQSILSESDNWSEKFAKAVPKGAQNMFRKNEIIQIKSMIKVLQSNVNTLIERPDLTLEVQVNKVDNINSNLDLIIERFGSGDSPYRAYPTFAVPVLLTLASFAADFEPILMKFAPDIFKLSDVFCHLADTIADYFPATLLNRLNEIAVEEDINKKQTPQRATTEALEFERPFKPDGYKLRDSVRCTAIAGDEKVPKTSLVLRDKANKKVYLDKIGGNCVDDYFFLVRSRLETTFGQAFNLVDPICTGDARKRRGERKPTGKLFKFHYSGIASIFFVYEIKIFQFYV